MVVIQQRRGEIERQQQAVLDEADSEAAFLQDSALIVAYAMDLATYLGKANVKSANAILKRCTKSIWFERGLTTIEYMVLLSDAQT